MKLTTPAALAMMVALGLTGCQPADKAPAEAAVEAAATPTPALHGEYSVNTPTGVDTGRFVFMGLSVQERRAFGAWDGGDRSGPPPVAVEILDKQSPAMVGYEDGPYPDEAIITVVPSRYSVAGNTVSFAGTSPATGDVLFEGTVDPVALDRSQAVDDGGMTVMTGTLTLGGKGWPGVTFGWNNFNPN